VHSTTTHSSTQNDLTASTHKTILVRDGQRGADEHAQSLFAIRGSRWWREDWPWAALLGAGMLVAGALAWLVAIIRVVLPYDETFLGLSRAQMVQANRHLLSFLAHDRVTLAGTMISIGIMYGGLALGPMRHGYRWARRAFVASAAVGFASFALVLGYRYVDPLHALAALVLLPFFVLAVRGRSTSPTTPHADPCNDRAWLRAQWGQLALVALGVGFLVGGITIATVGVTDVFVREDLSYLHTTASALRAANPHLVPLVAHDRAGFGGALVSDGVAFLLAALWGIRRGARWIWWTLLLAGLPGFVATIGIHLAVGYDNPVHLAPVGLALTLWTVGLGLCHASCWDVQGTSASGQ
jgi:dihydroorotate dehydrogenase